MSSKALALVLLAGCGNSPHEIVGPFTGKTYRFAVDKLTLPMQRVDFAEDLNGDGRVDNQIGNVIGGLAVEGGVASQPSADAQLGSGAVAPIVEITTDDDRLQNDPTVGVRWLDGDSPEVTPMGAAFGDGALRSNRALTYGDPVSVPLSLPFLVAADALRVDLVGTDIWLDSDGRGGFTGAIHGAIHMASDPSFMHELHRAFVQLVASDPQAGNLLMRLVDDDRDGTITFDEFVTNSILANVLAPDVQLFDADGSWRPAKNNMQKDSMSVGIGFHLVPCPTGNCVAAGAPSCLDRRLNGDETDLDCGGTSCRRCAGGAACLAGSDCQTGRCENGRCDLPRCDDGILDGFESDVDCGFNCPPCAVYNQKCILDGDCLPPMVCNGPGWFGGNCGPNRR